MMTRIVLFLSIILLVSGCWQSPCDSGSQSQYFNVNPGWRALFLPYDTSKVIKYIKNGSDTLFFSCLTYTSYVKDFYSAAYQTDCPPDYYFEKRTVFLLDSSSGNTIEVTMKANNKNPDDFDYGITIKGKAFCMPADRLDSDEVILRGIAYDRIITLRPCVSEPTDASVAFKMGYGIFKFVESNNNTYELLF